MKDWTRSPLRLAPLPLLALLCLLMLAGTGRAGNLFLENGNFDDNLDFWDMAPTHPDAWSSRDVDEAVGEGPPSGSALVGTETWNLGNGPSQCIRVVPGEFYTLGVWIHIPPGQPAGIANVRSRWYTGENCEFENRILLANRMTGPQIGVTGNGWVQNGDLGIAPPQPNINVFEEAHSLRIVLNVSSQACLDTEAGCSPGDPAELFTAHFDAVLLVPEPMEILLQGTAIAVLIGLAVARRRWAA